jgi:hypothetical protein
VTSAEYQRLQQQALQRDAVQRNAALVNLQKKQIADGCRPNK